MKHSTFYAFLLLYFTAVFVTVYGVCTINAASRDKAAYQLCDYRDSHKGRNKTLTTGWGSPIGDGLNILTAGPRGPALLQDFNFLDLMAHFDSERIPERVVHGKGAGAFGEFVVTNDITKYTRADLFSEVGKKTPVAVRFSFAVSEKATADTMRDVRGFAVKFYTEQGNWDLVGNNSPIFFVRDPYLFPSFIHSQFKNPVTSLKDYNQIWDFFSLVPETTHQVVMVYADRGIPDGYRYMHGFGSHTFKLVNADNEAVYCKFHYRSDQGVRNLSPEDAVRLAGEDPDYSIRDLYNAIANGDYPSWTLYIQVMTFEQAKKFKYNPFDLTKVWSKKEYPLIEVGRFTLNLNPKNYFQDVEQLAFCPARMVSGIEPSPDKMLQGRIFSYTDTQRHRLGVNNQQLRVNCPYRSKVSNYQRDGPSTLRNQGGAPNYYPNSFGGPQDNPFYKPSTFSTSGDVDSWNSHDDDNFSQATDFYRNVLKTDERGRLITNLANDISKAALFIQKRALQNFYQVDHDLGDQLEAALNKLNKRNQRH